MFFTIYLSFQYWEEVVPQVHLDLMCMVFPACRSLIAGEFDLLSHFER